jgi:hypothetical protein
MLHDSRIDLRPPNGGLLEVLTPQKRPVRQQTSVLHNNQAMETLKLFPGRGRLFLHTRARITP